MKCKIISGKVGSGKTGMLLNEMRRDVDNLVVTNDPSVIYIEMYMARNKIPGRCIGINSLAKTIAESIGINTMKEASREVQMAAVGKAIHGVGLRSFSDTGYDGGLQNKIHSFIIQCKEAGITPDDLDKAGHASPKQLENKLWDMACAYRMFDNVLKERRLCTKEDLVHEVVKCTAGKKLPFGKVIVDTLERYNQSTIALLSAIVPMTDEFCIAFNKTSKKAYEYDIYQEAMVSRIKFIDNVRAIECPIEMIETSRNKEKSGINIIEAEMFSRDTATKDNSDDVKLHESDTLYDEVDYVVSEIDSLVASGAKYSEIIVTSSSMERYINILGVTMKKHNIPYRYYRNTTIDKTSLFLLIDIIMDIKSNGLSVDSLKKLCHLNFFNLSNEEIMAIDALYNRFGDDAAIALKNGSLYDPDNTLIAQNAIAKVMIPLNQITESPENPKDLFKDIYNYMQDTGISDAVVEQANRAKQNGFVQPSDEIINTWNDIMGIFSSISTIYDDTRLEVHEIRSIFNKMASEKIARNGEMHHGQLTLLDMDNAQSRKSKYLFVIGCNEGYMPKPVGEHVISDRERLVINNATGKDLKLSSVYQTYKLASVYNTLILPEKLYVSWSLNDTDFKQLRPAGILSNAIKTFGDNITKDKGGRNGDEEKFQELLLMISKKRYQGKESASLHALFNQFANDPKYSRRLFNALRVLNNETIRFNMQNPADAYKEQEYFSVTRMETFSQCPFKHYVEHAIMPNHEKLFAETAADKGNYRHMVFRRFFDMCKSNIVDMINISHDDYLKVLQGIFDDMDKTHNEGFFQSNSRNKYIAYSVKEQIKTALWIAVQQLRRGTYKILANEYVIGKNISLELKDGDKTYHVTGVIDRVDMLNDDVRVIDYKAGNVEWSPQKQEAGIQIQLPLYAKAISNEGTRVTGMYYFRIKDFIADADAVNAPMKEYKLSGPTLQDTQVFYNNDTQLENGKASEVIGAEITLKGEISKRSKSETAESMKKIMDDASSVAISAIDGILSGNTEAYPLVMKDYDACEYCPYHCLCGIDRTIKSSVRKM